MNADRFVVEPI